MFQNVHSIQQFDVGVMSQLFEKLRRKWKESQAGMASKVESDAKSRRIAARRRRVRLCSIVTTWNSKHEKGACSLQLSIRRSKCINNTAEREKLQQIYNQHMTNASSDDVNGLLHHHPSWRSSGKLVVIQCKIEWLRITFVSHDNLDEV